MWEHVAGLHEECPIRLAKGPFAMALYNLIHVQPCISNFRRENTCFVSQVPALCMALRNASSEWPILLAPRDNASAWLENRPSAIIVYVSHELISRSWLFSLDKAESSSGDTTTTSTTSSTSSSHLLRKARCSRERNVGLSRSLEHAFGSR